MMSFRNKMDPKERIESVVKWRMSAIAKALTFAFLQTATTNSTVLHGVEIQDSSTTAATVAILFSPNGGCTNAIVSHIEVAKTQIRVMAYSFTSLPISKALVEAHKRGIDVRVVLDKSQRTERYSGADFLANAGIPVLIDASHAIQHNKVIIVDGQIVLTGSFNFTNNAEENNAENILVLASDELAKRYLQNWELHAGHSEMYVPKSDRESK